jgi:hypothetical protein
VDGVILWGPRDIAPGEVYTISFTADITNNESYADATIENIARFTSENIGDGVATARFTVDGSGGEFFVYLPTVMK